MKSICFKMIKFYQKYVSILFPKSCRYYPTCSQYALWQFENNNIFLAFFQTFMRILKCNQLFKGGINYPIIHKKFHPLTVFSQNVKFDINYWFVPFNEDKFYVIKSFKG